MTTPKPESWEERFDKQSFCWTDDYDGKRKLHTNDDFTEHVKDFIRHEKQLSYQESVEKMVKIIDEDIGHWHQTASMDVGYHDALVSIRHQLSILKGEKK